MGSSTFYNNLPTHEQSINDLLSTPDTFAQIPMDWEVVITDVKRSTSAVEKGQSELINLIATGSIIAALNIASESKIDIPFFFGGDGATFLVPPELSTAILNAHFLHQSNIKNEFGIDLRVGSIPVAQVYENGCELKIAKVSINSLLAIPIVLGTGLQFAEKLIKAKDIVFPQKTTKDRLLNLEGMECRWNKIPPPENANEVVCLLIDAVKESEQALVFKEILDQAEAIYGSHKNRNPISLPRLRLNAGLEKIKTELRMRQPNFGLYEWLKTWLFTFIGKYFYLTGKSGQIYLNELVQLSDIFVLDGRINMIISGDANQRKKLVTFLDELEDQQKIIYGLHVSKESIISCYVRNRNARHIHFVDGGDGGYTKAAGVLKRKLKLKMKE